MNMLPLKIFAERDKFFTIFIRHFWVPRASQLVAMFWLQLENTPPRVIYCMALFYRTSPSETRVACCSSMQAGRRRRWQGVCIFFACGCGVRCISGEWKNCNSNRICAMCNVHHNYWYKLHQADIKCFIILFIYCGGGAHSWMQPIAVWMWSESA